MLNEDVYEPREDSLMLADYIENYARGSVLDIGTGSGILANTAAKNPKVSIVVGVDINKRAIDYCRINIRNKKVKFIYSNLFSNVKGKYDLIVFNPPYLPRDKDDIKDKAIIGGKQGYEILAKFLNSVGKYLNKNGRILIVFSSLTGKDRVDETIRKNKMTFKLLERSHVFFEDIYMYIIEKQNCNGNNGKNSSK